MSEANYTLKLTLAEATEIRNLVTERRSYLERKIQVDMREQGGAADAADREEYAVVEQLGRRIG